MVLKYIGWCKCCWRWQLKETNKNHPKRHRPDVYRLVFSIQLTAALNVARPKTQMKFLWGAANYSVEINW